MSLLKLLWMKYGWLDPLGRVRWQPHWCSHFRVDKSYVSVRLRFEKSSPRWRIVGRERKSRKSTTTRINSRIRIIISSSRDRSTGVHQLVQAVAVDRLVDRRRRTVDRPVDRLTLPNSRLGTVDRGLGRLTGTVDRQTGLDCFSRKFAELETSPIRNLILLGFPWVY